CLVAIEKGVACKLKPVIMCKKGTVFSGSFAFYGIKPYRVKAFLLSALLQGRHSCRHDENEGEGRHNG
ncbi:MAG: hypothetical protein PUG31_09720, partial [Eubacteriales bacterium]|nr:hypothetical protein [Eubacteriales bacterium]